MEEDTAATASKKEFVVHNSSSTYMNSLEAAGHKHVWQRYTAWSLKIEGADDVLRRMEQDIGEMQLISVRCSDIIVSRAAGVSW